MLLLKSTAGGSHKDWMQRISALKCAGGKVEGVDGSVLTEPIGC